MCMNFACHPGFDCCSHSHLRTNNSTLANLGFQTVSLSCRELLRRDDVARK